MNDADKTFSETWGLGQPIATMMCKKPRSRHPTETGHPDTVMSGGAIAIVSRLPMKAQLLRKATAHPRSDVGNHRPNSAGAACQQKPSLAPSRTRTMISSGNEDVAAGGVSRVNDEQKKAPPIMTRRPPKRSVA